MLETLSEVQSLDLERDALAATRGETPQELLDARARRSELETEHRRVKHLHDDLRKQVAAAELELKSLQERRKSASESALRASSAKEMSQFQNQELQFATRAQELEEDALPLMERLEAAAHELAGLQEQLDELAPHLEGLEVAERARVADVDALDADLADRRERHATSVDATLLRQYEQVRKARRGLALVGLLDGKRCGGCHVQLPIHVVQKVRKGQGVVRCPSCGRLLYQEPNGG
jgi:predicted  nucleic acid-binding Zn-ribbon protein